MKLVGIAGSIADQSYNRTLLNFIAKHFTGLIDVDVLDINEVPMFNQDDDQTNSPVIQNLCKKSQPLTVLLLLLQNTITLFPQP